MKELYRLDWVWGVWVHTKFMMASLLCRLGGAGVLYKDKGAPIWMSIRIVQNRYNIAESRDIKFRQT